MPPLGSRPPMKIRLSKRQRERLGVEVGQNCVLAIRPPGYPYPGFPQIVTVRRALRVDVRTHDESPNGALAFAIPVRPDVYCWPEGYQTGGSDCVPVWLDAAFEDADFRRNDPRRETLCRHCRRPGQGAVCTACAALRLRRTPEEVTP